MPLVSLPYFGVDNKEKVTYFSSLLHSKYVIYKKFTKLKEKLSLQSILFRGYSVPLLLKKRLGDCSFKRQRNLENSWKS